MCLICVDLRNKKLTPIEALANYSEIQETIDEDHVPELLNLISDALMPERARLDDNSPDHDDDVDWKYGSD